MHHRHPIITSLRSSQEDVAHFSCSLAFFNICLGGFWSCLEICNEMMMRMSRCRDAPCVCCFAVLSWCPAEMMMMVPKRFSSASAELSIAKHFVFVFSLESQFFSRLFRNRCSDHQSKISWPQKYSNLFYVYFVFRSARFCFLLADVDGEGRAGEQIKRIVFWYRVFYGDFVRGSLLGWLVTAFFDCKWRHLNLVLRDYLLQTLTWSSNVVSFLFRM